VTYQEQADRYTDPDERARYQMCIREQAHATFALSEVPAERELAESVIRGHVGDIDTLIAAICVGPNSATLEDDGALLGAVQLAWPGTAAAMYTQEGGL
jgi:hypothetical protein